MARIGLQFVLGSDWSSQLISWWGQGYRGYSHVDAILSDGSLLGARSDTIGARPPGVQIRPKDYEKWVRQCRVWRDVEASQLVAWDKFLRAQVGSGYDKGDILGLIIGKPLMEAGHWICSALQMAALQRICVLPDMPETPQQVPPNMLLYGCMVAGFKLER